MCLDPPLPSHPFPAWAGGYAATPAVAVEPGGAVVVEAEPEAGSGRAPPDCAGRKLPDKVKQLVPGGGGGGGGGGYL